jgi:hypothetical protein
MPGSSRPVDRKHWRQSIIRHLEDFPRQLEALRYSTGTFGDAFDADAFAAAYASEDPAAYLPVLAVERGFGRLQNYMGALTDDGTKLAQLERRTLNKDEPRIQPALEALRDAGAITKTLYRDMIAAQKSRSVFEHDYTRVGADDVHRAVTRLLGVADEFHGRYRIWVAPYLVDGE